jgi:hypothetical protein
MFAVQLLGVFPVPISKPGLITRFVEKPTWIKLTSSKATHPEDMTFLSSTFTIAEYLIWQDLRSAT